MKRPWKTEPEGALLVALFLACACGGGEAKDDGTVDAAPDPQAEEPAPEDAQEGEGDVLPEPSLELPPETLEEPEYCYPPPYGTGIGDTLQNHQFISIEDTLVSMCDFHRDESMKLLLVYATAGWCIVCHYESQSLPSYYNDYHGQGLEILAAVFEDANGNPATRAYAREYAVRYNFNFPTVVDNTFQLGIYFDKAATPMNMFVNLETMEILDIQLGFDAETDSMRRDIEVYLSRIER